MGHTEWLELGMVPTHDYILLLVVNFGPSTRWYLYLYG